MVGTLRFAHPTKPAAPARPHPEERVFARLEGWMAPAGPRGSRRRCAPPHHEGL